MMITIGIFIGIYAYLIFLLGILHLLYPNNIVLTSIIFFASYVFLKQHKTIVFFNKCRRFKLQFSKNKLLLSIILLLILQMLINLVGVLGPELAFDALWYHLTLPKLFLINHSVYHIPGGLLYYSDMPKLAEMLYIGALSFGNEIAVKFIHFLFGILTSIALYKLSRKFFSPLLSFVAVVIFYSNLVVAWESTTAYIDLVRSFFEIMALWTFISWWQKKEFKFFIQSAIMMGLAVETKILSLGSLLIFLIFIAYYYLLRKKSIKKFLEFGTVYIGISLLIPLPWFLFSYINTGNPIYPFFTTTLVIAPTPLSLLQFPMSVWDLLMRSSDPLSPIYILFLPLIVSFFPKLRAETKLVVIYSLLGIIIWYLTPQIGGGRFILPYLPAFSLVCAAVMQKLFESKEKYNLYLSKFLFILMFIISITSITYRLIANSQYLPVLFGGESKQTFLTHHLNFSFGDFYDTDNYFKNNFTSRDVVLLYGFHNLYYIDFPFIDSSWVKKGDSFNYIALQNTTLPNRFRLWKQIYKNNLTHVTVFTYNKKVWQY